ncbi:hypothetical protein MLD38_008726 [Melastoma candidum]|uniref:Uncharacterized protein n=1 Tax=Melastoma candidum TaxID=119954 RepID=A0ACB9RUW7_9MYRT|nr:hypothetical protein MLD38_008726 [Melastoma candidum]
MATNPQPQPSTSTSIMESVNGSHTFTISGYSLAKGMGPGKYISSDVFTVGGYDWAMYFYPDGKNAEDTMMYVSVFIALASDGTDVRALFELTLVDQSGKGKHKVHSHFDRALESGPYSLKYRGSMWGYKRFLRRTALETSDYIKDDKIIMHCTVGVVRNRVEGPKMYSIPLPPSNMGQGLKNLLESEVGSDVTFVVGDEKFRAHKLILAARSHVFRAQFFGLIGDRNIEEVAVEDVEPSIFKAMLQFIYTDDLPNIREITGSMSSHTSIIVVQHLLAAADRYNLDRLKILCEAKLCEEISPDTVATTLALAEQHHCHQLKAICLKYAADPINLGVVMQSEGYKNLENGCPSLLSELLNTFALVNEKFANVSIKKKRSSSADDADRGTGESVNSEGRRVRRRF